MSTATDQTDAQPMSTRRVLLLIISSVGGLIGLVLVPMALIGLRQLAGAAGDLFAPSDFGFILIDLLWLGATLLVGGAVTATLVLRAQLRHRSRSH